MSSDGYRSCSPSKEPQQNVFTFDNVVFSSRFDSGNLKNVVKVDNSNVIQLAHSIVRPVRDGRLLGDFFGHVLLLVPLQRHGNCSALRRDFRLQKSMEPGQTFFPRL